MRACGWGCSKAGVHHRDDGVEVVWCHDGDVKHRFPELTAHMYEMSGWDGYSSDTYTQPGHEGFGMVTQVLWGASCLLIRTPGQLELWVAP